MDEQLEPVAEGVRAELYIAGEGLARGYINKAGLTAERFVPDPHSAKAGARMYRTGDVARYRRGGEIEYLGRVDQQVKVRGYRIELQEVERALLEVEGVEEAAAVVSERAGGKQIVGFVVMEEGKKASVEEIKGEVRRRVPGTWCRA